MTFVPHTIQGTIPWDLRHPPRRAAAGSSSFGESDRRSHRNGTGEGKIARVGQGNEHDRDPLPLGGAFRSPAQGDRGLAERVIEDLNLAPGHGPPPQTERFHHGFFGRKPGGQTNAACVGRSRPLVFSGGEETRHEHISPALERLLDPPHLDDVDPHSPDVSHARSTTATQLRTRDH